MELRNNRTKDQRNKGTKEQRNKETKNSSNWVRHNQVFWSSFLKFFVMNLYFFLFLKDKLFGLFA